MRNKIIELLKEQYRLINMRNPTHPYIKYIIYCIADKIIKVKENKDEKNS